MESKDLIYSVMQRVLNDLIYSDINDCANQISFIEVATTLAKVGKEPVEPELLDMTNHLGSLIKGQFMIKQHECTRKKLVASFIGDDQERHFQFIENTKEAMFLLFLNVLTKN